jgi:hypothetical protein
MSEPKPTVYILHGDDHFGIMNFIDGLIGKMGDPTMAQMNISRLQAGVDAEGEIRSACLAIPFLSWGMRITYGRWTQMSGVIQTQKNVKMGV